MVLGMGQVIELIPGAGLLKLELDRLRDLHGSMVDHRVTILSTDGTDVTDIEAEHLGLVIRLLYKALAPFVGSPP